ncbi:MAG: CBS and ACT domain-containing protein [Desulfotalea sp.]
MYVGKIMITNLVTITPDTSLVEARRLMDCKPIDHLLIIDSKGNLVGIISDRDLKQYWASPATSLSANELSYLLEKVMIKSVMVKTVLTISPSTTVERAAYIMQQNNINALPVLEDGKLAGIITSSDVMGVLLHAIGMGEQSCRLGVFVKDQVGALAQITTLLKDESINIQSIFSFPEYDFPGIHQLIFRVANYDEIRAKKTLEADGFKVVSEYIEDVKPYIPE